MERAISINIDSLPKKDDDTFSKEILSRLDCDDVGDICRTDPTIRLIGRELFKKDIKKVDKEMETRKSVMADMRLLGALLLSMKEENSALTGRDIFERSNFECLETGVHKITTYEDGKLKYGKKQKLLHSIINGGKILHADLLIKHQDPDAEEVSKFLDILKHKKNAVFGDAQYQINVARQERLRAPEAKVNEKFVANLHKYIRDTIAKLSDEYTIIDQAAFIELRDAICTRITLFNGRRGGEPSRMKITQFKDALQGRWINKDALTKLKESEKALFKKLIIAYQTGKGNHLVPVLIPVECINGLRILINTDIRKSATVWEGNVYLFPNTQLSRDHVLGWASISKMCKDAGVEALLTATSNRKRVSTLYAESPVPESDREFFYNHMGHSAAVNKGTYQFPLAIQAVLKVGPHFVAFDGKYSVFVTQLNCSLIQHVWITDTLHIKQPRTISKLVLFLSHI